jgi:hypothetical protein
MPGGVQALCDFDGKNPSPQGEGRPDLNVDPVLGLSSREKICDVKKANARRCPELSL